MTFRFSLSASRRLEMVLRPHLFPQHINYFTFSVCPNHSPVIFYCQNGLKSNYPTASVAAAADSGIQFREKILYLEALNINISKALEKNPDIRAAKLPFLQSVESCICSMGIDRSALSRILDMFPEILTADPHADIYPVFEFLLNDVGISFPDIRTSVVRCPRLLASSVDGQLKPAFQFLQNLGFSGPDRITAKTTVLLVSNVEKTLKRKIDFLTGLGFSYEEVKCMVLRSPRLLTYSVEKNFRPKLEYFLEEMNGDVNELKRFPQFFSFSLEGKIRSRHSVLVEHGLSMPLSAMLKVSDGEFVCRLIEMQLQRVEKMNQ